ncbi:MAG: GNAT family N-acetyltransferase [Alphaproteobacteria bacterium]|nr:GNAT family N-acetyltransferase [Alphaproteobacteria bacterium]
MPHWHAMDATEWDALLSAQTTPTPFMRHAYLSALHETGCASLDSGWQLQLIALRQGGALMAACPMYFKNHSYGEYIFDWAWARAYERHGLEYFPKAVISVPFTPVPGSRLLARDALWRDRLLQAAVALSEQADASSLHLLWADEADLASATRVGLMRRDGVQFHWHHPGVSGFDDFLATLRQDKRKKIRQERRKVVEAGIDFVALHSEQIDTKAWDFFHQCYAQTYAEHGNPPYLNPAFFQRMARDMAQNWVLFLARREGRPIACSLVAVQGLGQADSVAYGRYWGALERHDCLHFEACYYQPIEWCLRHGISRFEGGAQGEHKMSRALLPTPTASAHHIRHPGFAQAVGDFLARERQGVAAYIDDLELHTPLRGTTNHASSVKPT